MTANNDNAPFEQMQVRLDKRAHLLAAGENPYPVATNPVTAVRTLRDTYAAALAPNERTDNVVTVTGRLMSIRNVGKLSFAVLLADGARIQLMLSRAEIGENSHLAWRQRADLGDIVTATGVVGRSSTGELSVYIQSWAITGKALRPLPNAHADLGDETRARQRYLDTLLDEDARRTVLLRTAMVRAVRDFLHEQTYTELETPMLHTVQGGATARPFTTHANALDQDLFLRIAPELYLKRAIIGGFDRVFEINRNFRNEGMDATHLNEFTMLEAYAVGEDYLRMADLVERLLRAVIIRVQGFLPTAHRGTLDTWLGAPWARVSLYDSLSVAVGQAITPETDLMTLTALAKSHGVEVQVPTAGKLVEELWEHLVKPTLTRPTFVLDYPTDTSPLTAAHRTLPGRVEKWDLYVNGLELGTGYSELTDPVEQRARFQAQANLAGRGDAEAMGLDEAFLMALEYGMPPTGGIGLGIDRLLLLLNGGTARDNVLFPLVR